MSNSILNIKSFSNLELSNETLRRMEELQMFPSNDPVVTAPASQMSRPSPWGILKAMESQGSMWDEDPRSGFSNDLITFMFAYIGLPTLTDDDAWCACTQSFINKLCGYDIPANPAVAIAHLDIGTPIEYGQLRVGDNGILRRTDSNWRGHIGKLFDNTFDNTIPLLGGNQSNKIKESNYNMTTSVYEIAGFRRLTEKDIVSYPDFETLNKLDLI